MLLAGRTESQVAKALGVTRQAVNGWHKNAAFEAELLERRSERFRAVRIRAEARIRRAVDTLALAADPGAWTVDDKGVQHGIPASAVRAAGKLLEIMGMGPDDLVRQPTVPRTPMPVPGGEWTEGGAGHDGQTADSEPSAALAALEDIEPEGEA